MKNKAPQNLGRLGGKVTLSSDEINRLHKAGGTINVRRGEKTIRVDAGDFGELTFDYRYRTLAEAYYAKAPEQRSPERMAELRLPAVDLNNLDPNKISPK